MGYQPAGKPDPKLMETIFKKEDLLAYFYDSCKKPKEELIGMEWEMHGIYSDTYKPLTHLGKDGMRQLMLQLVEEQGWQIEKKEGPYIVSITRGGTHFSLESSQGMGELASRVHGTIHSLATELRVQHHELVELSKAHKIIWLGLGYQPFASIPETKRVKLQRFMLRDEAPVKNKFKNDDRSWRNIASVQANIDYNSEEDARKKFQTLLRLGPLLSAMFSNAPLRQGKDSKYVSYRTHIFRELYPWRSGMRKEFLNENFNFETWVDFCLRVPMVGIFRDGKWLRVGEKTFAAYLKSGYEKHQPILEDWIIHLSYIYTDTRIKNYIELRVCDSVPPFLIPALQALVKAFVYHPEGERALKELTWDWTFEDFNKLYAKIAVQGMETTVHRKKLLGFCKEILEIASQLLRSIGDLNEKGEDESIYLKEIKYFVDVEEKSPGTWLQEKWNGPWKQNPEALIAWASSNQFANGLVQS